MFDFDFEEKPWGEYQVLRKDDLYKVKEIIVEPKQRLSYQRHQKRDEVWVIIQGEALVWLDGITYIRRKGDIVHVPRGMKHRIMNMGEDDLRFIEVQTGDYFGEDDIERFEDDYGRIDEE